MSFAVHHPSCFKIFIYRWLMFEITAHMPSRRQQEGVGRAGVFEGAGLRCKSQEGRITEESAELQFEMLKN